MSIKSRQKQKEKLAIEHARLLERDGYVPTPEEVKHLGMVFTPPALVNQMIDRLSPESYLPKDKNTLDPACGTGNFLVEFLRKRMSAGLSHAEALIGIYGVDISQKVLDICKKRLSLGSNDETIWNIINHNIVCADYLDPFHSGWKEVGYVWNKKYDLIAGNPPFNGQRPDKDRQKKIKDYWKEQIDLSDKPLAVVAQE